MRKYIKYFCLLLVFVLLSGCVKEYKDNDIADYVHDTLGLKNFEVLSRPDSIPDKDGFTDYRWSVRDNDNNIQFHVLDNYYYNYEAMTNSLDNDYYAEVVLKYKKDININNLKVKNEVINNLDVVTVICNYSNKKEIEDCYNSLLKFKKFFNDKGFKADVNYEVNYNFKFNDKDVNSINNANYSKASVEDINESNYNEMLKKYYVFGLSYQIDSVISEMNKNDLNMILQDDKTYLIYKSDDTYYQNLISIEYGYGISYPTLYMIFKEEGFVLEGDKNHYKVTNKTGDVYEFSSEFYDEIEGYYHYKNGEKENSYAKSYNYLIEKQVNDFFDLNIKLKRNSEN